MTNHNTYARAVGVRREGSIGAAADRGRRGGGSPPLPWRLAMGLVGAQHGARQTVSFKLPYAAER